ncbi:hypothetical protein ACFOGJ_04835 [Marinibaculum pumilum]|uniref:Uncharacterized protein n=1 Tax=Marinibaculum pumilum TaxID=1766165 RepID=A0ABV7KW08_9PROT
MRQRICLLISGLGLLLSACTTPDLTPFSEQTAALSTSVQAEHDATLAQLKQNADWWTERSGTVSQHVRDKARANPRVAQALTELSRTAERAQGFATRYDESARRIDQVLKVAVAYADALVALAAAGETGGEAWDSLSRSVSEAGKVFGVAMPGAGTAMETINQIGRQLAQWHTRIEAQEDIRSIMADTQPLLDELAVAMAELYAVAGPGPDATPAGPQHLLLTGAYQSRKAALLEAHGRNRIALYEGLAVDQVLVNEGQAEREAFATRFELFAGALGTEIGRLPAERGIRTGTKGAEFVAYRDIIAAEEPNYRLFKQAQGEADRWYASRVKALGAISAAIASWSSTHRKVLEELQRCGGYSAFQQDCIRISMGTLEEALDTLERLHGPEESPVVNQ